MEKQYDDSGQCIKQLTVFKRSSLQIVSLDKSKWFYTPYGIHT